MAKKKNIKDVEEEKVIKKYSETEEVEETLLEKIDDDELDEDDKEIEEKEDESLESADDEVKEEDYDIVEEISKEKGKKTKKKKKESKQKHKDGYLANIWKELKKVVWPKMSEIAKYSFAVIIFCIVLCLFFEGINLLAAFLKELFS